MNALRIHPELQVLIPPLSQEERAQLTANLQAEGCRDALIVWEEERTILDGHNRYAICQQYDIPYTVQSISLPTLDAAKSWMLRHQLGRRNLTPEQMSYLRGKQYEVQKQQGKRTDLTSGNTCQKSEAADHLAEQHKVSARTIRNDATFATAVDTIATAVPDARTAILARDTKVGRQEVRALSAIARANPQTARHVVDAVRQAPTPKAARRVVQEAARNIPPVTKPAPLQPPPPVLTLLPELPAPQKGIEELTTPEGKTLFVLHRPDSKPVFNRTNEMVDWASWTWNPVTGCWHGCDYCYAREIANNERMADSYPKKFEPTFHPARLAAPANTPFPKTITRPADRNVFTCSMADLFGKWVPEQWILDVFARVAAHPEWNFLFLTKFPQRLQAICDVLGGFPDNAWVGCTVDAQARVATAERAFRDIKARVRWLSVEPMRERLTFQSLAMFDWVVMGGQTASYYNNTPAFQPPWEWVEHLWTQARAAGVKVYWKENLTVRPKEVPWTDHAPEESRHHAGV